MDHRRMRLRLPAPVLLLGLAAACGANAPETGLEAPVEIVAPAGEGSAEPNLALGSGGRVLLTWLEPLGDSAHALRFAALEGDRWSEPRTIARGGRWFVNWADFPSLVALPDGRLAAHYLERHPDAESGYAYDVRVVQSTDEGRSWSAPVTPHRDGVAAEHGFVSLLPAEGDSLGVLWLDGRKYSPEHGGTQEMTLRYTTLAPDGGRGVEEVVDERTCDCCQTSAVLTARGPVAVYRDRSAAEIRDVHVSRRIGGSWTPGRPVHADGWHIEACPVNGPSIAAAGGRVAVAWFTAAGDAPRVLVAFSDDAGASFGAPVRVDDGAPAGRADVELLPDGSAVVGWLERTGESGAEVRARRVTPAGARGEARRVARSSGERASGFPRMASRGGEVFFAWTDPGAAPRVRVARLRAGGES